MDNKKSTFRTLAEALTFEQLTEVDLSLDHLDKRKLSIAEVKEVIREAFKDAKAAAEVEAKELAHGWGDAEVENEIEWVKALNLKEFFDPSEVNEEFPKGDDDEDDTSEEE